MLQCIKVGDVRLKFIIVQSKQRPSLIAIIASHGGEIALYTVNVVIVLSSMAFEFCSREIFYM